MSHIHKQRAIKRFDLAVLLLAIVLSFTANSVTYAGDQDGVSGYKTKIYCQNGDGYGNESAYQGGNGTPSLSSAFSSSDAAVEQESIDLKTVLLHLRGLFWGRFR